MFALRTKEQKILHIDLDAFFVSVEQALNPELRGKPVVVGGEPGSRGVVASASYEARAYGICAGMPLRRAYCLCPEAIFLEGNFQRYRDASQRFMSILAQFTPLLEPGGLDEAYLDLTGFESLYGPANEVALRIKQRIKGEIKVTASVGIATSKLVAKVASELAKPDGLIEVMPGEERLFLAPLPIAMLPGVGPKTEQSLMRLGVTTVGELANLPVSLSKASLGALGEVLHQHALGIDEREIEPPKAAKSISRETTFADDTLDYSFLKATLCYLSERVGAELRRDGRMARCITLKLRYADFDTITRSRTLRAAKNSNKAIFDVGVQLLEAALRHRRQLVRLIGIGVSSLVSDGKQLSFFDRSTEQLDMAVDCIRSRYGFDAIQRGQILPLKNIFATENGDYVLSTPALSR